MNSNTRERAEARTVLKNFSAGDQVRGKATGAQTRFARPSFGFNYSVYCVFISRSSACRREWCSCSSGSVLH
jgi:hypothetical protein